jgi:hypothetical protein
MLDQALNLLQKREVVDLKRRGAGVVRIAVGWMLFVLASLAGVFALYLWLSTRIEPWPAALAISMLLALLGGIVVLSGRNMMRPQHKGKQDLDASFKTLMNTADTGARAGKENAPLGIVALAAIAGFIIARKMHK